ncbi:MAG: hypothetical protein COA78_12715 [Blastopirellula sp.]|nr:MAG: hypothetical protein COA78_12715 [Blastopirellula sp.]
MTFIVTENCINCKFQDCVAACPVDCFYVGENFLVIHPDDCIDCGVCEPECPADAIKPDTQPGLEYWLEINTKYAEIWPNITEVGEVPADAEEWNGRPNKADLLITGDASVEPHVQKPVYMEASGRTNKVKNGFEIDGVTIAKPQPEQGASMVNLDQRPPIEDDGYEIDGLSMSNES